jgi:hypothetical protein
MAIRERLGQKMAATIFIALTKYEILATRSVKKVLRWRCPFNLFLVNFEGSLSHFAIWQFKKMTDHHCPVDVDSLTD